MNDTIRPDYRLFRLRTRYTELCHSAKGSVWEDHKYVKRVDGTYYYPNGYDGGRTMESFQKDLRNKRFTQAQVNADASAKKTTSQSTTTKKQTVTKQVTKKLDKVNETKKLASFDQPALSDELAKKAKEAFKNEETKTTSKKASDKDLSTSDIEEFAKEVIKGTYGVGADRKKALGDNYKKIQDKVNELLRKSGSTKVSTSSVSSKSKSSSNSSKKTSSSKKTTSKKKEASTSTTTTSTKKTGIDLDKVYNVYNKKKR